MVIDNFGTSSRVALRPEKGGVPEAGVPLGPPKNGGGDSGDMRPRCLASPRAATAQGWNAKQARRRVLGDGYPV